MGELSTVEKFIMFKYRSHRAKQKAVCVCYYNKLRLRLNKKGQWWELLFAKCVAY